MKYPFLLVAFLLVARVLPAQNETQATVSGIIRDAVTGAPIEFVTVFVEGESYAVETAGTGRYRLEVPADRAFVLVFSRLGYKEVRKAIEAMPRRSNRQVDVELAPADSDLEVIVRESKIEEGGMVREDVSQMKLLPTTTGNFESVLPHIALGTTSGSGGELTSQYNVRGGNYDENLVYVNDFEIYRPQLIRAGQQEGLTFPNIDLIRDLSFSSGGFQARYGDKLSSVLDISYKRPDSLRGSVALSFLGGSAHLEGSMGIGNDPYRKLRYLVGLRYKTNRYLLGTLDVSGEYIPNFTDIQAYVTYDVSRSWQLGILANYNRSVYRFEPNERSTAFGLINFSLELFSSFEGQEVDDFTTSLGGVSMTYLPDRVRNPIFLKFMAWTSTSDENERFDILGNYSLRQIDSNLGSSEFGEVLSELGSGTQHNYVRNFLDLRVTSFQHKGGVEFQHSTTSSQVTSSHFLQWSVRYNREMINDDIREWERLDSAGYSLPYDTTELTLFSLIRSRNDLSSNRFSAYLQDTYTFRDNQRGELQVAAGLRANYWDLNGEFLISPRLQLLYKPLSWKTDVSFRLASGLYVQPPFYREMRGPDGSVNTDLKAQKSVHIVGGMTLDFYIGRNNPKKFRFITEAYYKTLWDLVSYEIENVRIRYSGLNDATGYVAGLDLRLNGEFVPGAESWINLSLLTAREKLNGIQHLRREVGQEEATPVEYVPRPTDQLVTLSVFFQDYLPKNENFKMNLNLTVGTGLPFGIPNNNTVYRNTYRFEPYHRIDIGFAVLLWDQSRRSRRPQHPLRFTRNTWVSFEVFNLMDVQNQSGNTWIKTVFLQQYAIPNYLTSRRINLRLRMDF